MRAHGAYSVELRIGAGRVVILTVRLLTARDVLTSRPLFRYMAPVELIERSSPGAAVASRNSPGVVLCVDFSSDIRYSCDRCQFVGYVDELVNPF